MVNVNGENRGHYDSLDTKIYEIIIKKVYGGKWKITKKIEVEDDNVKTMNFTDNEVDHFALDFSNSKQELSPTDLGFDYK